jgi:hypothetical protein
MEEMMRNSNFDRGARSLAALALTLAGAEALPASAIDTSTQDPVAIMRAVDQRPTGDRVMSRVQMTIKDSSGTRERILSSRARNDPDASKSLSVLEAPADQRDTAFLGVDYRKSETEDEQWMYLPKLHRVTRIPSNGRSGAFLGSDFTYADLARPDPANYTFKLIEASVKVDQDDCWLIEATPKSARIVQETGYSKTQLWVSKTKLLPIQIKAWLTAGQKLKYIKLTDVRLVKDTWTPYQLQAKTVAGAKVESETVMQVLNLQYDAAEVTDGDFTMQRLEQGL